MPILSRIAKARRFIELYGQHLPLTIPAIFNIRCRILRIDGVLRRGGSALSVVYAGRGRNLPYFLKSTFARYEVREECRATVFSFRERAERWAADADVYIADVGWPYDASINRDGRFLAMPDWISMGVDLADTWEGTLANFRRDARKNDLRLIRRNEYRYETTSTRAEMKRFYDEIYVPYTKFIHDADSLITPKHHVVSQGCKGSLIKVFNDTELVSAGIVVPAGDVLVSLWMGIPEHLHRDRPEACISALYLFFLQYAQEHGYSAVDFAGTRALLDDGALRFKRKWGAVVEDTFSPNAVMIRIISATPGALAFCRSMPLLARSRHGLEAIVFTDGQDEGANGAEALLSRYRIGGLDRMVIISTAGREQTVSLEQADDLPVLTGKVSPAELPNVYCRRWLDAQSISPAVTEAGSGRRRERMESVDEEETHRV